MTTAPHHCADCRDGEHENEDDDVRFVVVTDPDRPNRFVKRAWLCRTHREDIYEADGYTVRILK